jgi:ABC-2 type transport system permease protein
LKFTKLLCSREPSGTIGYEQLIQHGRDPAMLRALQRHRERMTFAAQIESEGNGPPAQKPTETKTQTQTADEKQAGDKQAAAADAPQPAEPAKTNGPIKVIYVADIDLLFPAFVRIRARPQEGQDEEGIRWEFENVTFALNIIDTLASDTDYIPIRKRKPRYTTLRAVEARVEESRKEEYTKAAECRTKCSDAKKEAEAENERVLKDFQQIVEDLQKKKDAGEEIDEADLRVKVQRLKEQKEVLDRRLLISNQRFERERDRDIERIQREVGLEIQRMQFIYKFWAVFIPWMPPALIGLVVFVQRRLREREGIEKSRLR